MTQKFSNIKFLWIGSAIFLIVVIAIVSSERKVEINFHSGRCRSTFILFRYIHLPLTGESVHEPYLHFVKQDRDEIPDRWDFSFTAYRDSRGSSRTQDGIGMTVMKLLQFCDRNLTPEQQEEVRRKFVAIMKEKDRNKRDYQIIDLYFRLQENIP